MIAQALSDPNEQSDMTLKDGRSLHMVKIVGAVREADLRSTNLFVQLEDGTGLIQVKVWVNDGDDPSAISQLRQEACREHSYIRVIGQVREFDGTRQIVANDMRPVTDSNEVTYHFLEVAHSYEKMKKVQSQQASGMGFGIGNMASGGPQGAGIKAAGQGLDGGKGAANSVNDEVINVIRGLGGESGAHVDEVVVQVSQKGFSEMDIRNSVTYLSNEGLIYSTIDEDHYQYAE